MNIRLASRTNLAGAWCGYAYVVLFIIGWWGFGGFLPLHEPSAGADEVARFFRDDTNGIRIGMIVLMWAAACFIPFTATLAFFVQRIEGGAGFLTYTTLLAGFSNAMLTFYPPLWWLVIAYRPMERTAEQIGLLNDVAWLQFVGGVSLLMPLYLVTGIAAFCDKSKEPAFPRWFGFLSLWVFIGLIPDQFLFFYTEGPFAWNGLLSFWIPAFSFALWIVLAAHVTRQASLRLAAEAADSSEAAAHNAQQAAS